MGVPALVDKSCIGNSMNNAEQIESRRANYVLGILFVVMMSGLSFAIFYSTFSILIAA